MECLNCKSQFDSRGARRYCSDQCKKEYRTKLLGYEPGAKKCLVCGNEFVPKRADAKYCSPKCGHRAKYLSHHPVMIKKCLSCGKEFETTAANKQLFCSVKCMRHNDYVKNIDKNKERRKERYRKEPERARERVKIWRATNREKYLKMQA